MYFLLSGEGPTDIGLCAANVPACEGDRHEAGPMTLVVSRIVESQLKFSFLDTGYYGYVSKSRLTEKAAAFKRQRKSLRLPGKKKPKETMYFYRNARSLALCAKEKEAELNDEVVAVLFRDSDGTATDVRGLWQDKWNSVVQGFHDEAFNRGVPMIPKPKSEAWIICCVKKNSYRDCEALEEWSGNDNSPKSLKRELARLLNGLPSRIELCEMVADGRIDVARIAMPSFVVFAQALRSMLK